MMAKYYKVIKENFLWQVGAIVSDYTGGYRPIDATSIWDMTNVNESDYISKRVVEASPDYFREVFPINLLTKTIYKCKEEALLLMNKEYTE